MTSVYRTPNAFFVSSAGKRLQRQIAVFFNGTDFHDRSAVLTGSVFPFLKAFEQNNPDIVFEREAFDPADFFSGLPQAHSVDMAFISALNDSVTDNLSSLIKEADRLLKPQGRLFLLVKKPKKFFASVISGMPETAQRFLLNETVRCGFFIQKKKNLLRFPYGGSFWNKADDLLFSLSAGAGNFLIVSAQKRPTVAAAAENYKPTRITKASVFTSPRT